MDIRITTFSYKKHPIRREPGLVFDCRVLPNPWNDPSLRQLDGRHVEVFKFLAEDDRMWDLVEKILLRVKEENPTQIFLGCHGGRHRSVTMGIVLKSLLDYEYDVELTHEELGEEQ